MDEGLDEFLTRYHDALGEFFRGNFDPTRQLWSDRDDITLGNPFGPFVNGMTQVVEAMQRAAANYREGRAIGFDTVSRHVSGDLAALAEVEHYESKIGGRDELSPVDLRVTTILRHEDGAWRLLHRHADAITTMRTADSLLDGS